MSVNQNLKQLNNHLSDHQKHESSSFATYSSQKTEIQNLS